MEVVCCNEDLGLLVCGRFMQIFYYVCFFVFVGGVCVNVRMSKLFLFFG